jgi:hypothetical protein
LSLLQAEGIANPVSLDLGHHGISGDFGQFFSTAILRYNQWLAYVTD